MKPREYKNGKHGSCKHWYVSPPIIEWCPTCYPWNEKHKRQ